MLILSIFFFQGEIASTQRNNNILEIHKVYTIHPD